MTRINTNVSSLNAQKTLARSNASLQESLTRLSTGLRINTGKDDPAGLIASEVLRSDIISVERAISNSKRANQMIATADSALGQVSSLLNDIRGLVSEAANTGAMSQEQIAANQLQIDSSLEAIDRIAQVTQFQGRRLLDGSLDFLTEDVDSAVLTGVRIDQANFGTLDQIDVTIEVVTQATQAELTHTTAAGTITGDVVLEIGGKNGFEAFSFADGSSVSDIAQSINLVSDALGVTATVDGTNLVFTANEYGSDAFVSVRSLNGTAFAVTDAAAATVERTTGTDVDELVNGIKALGKGLTATINTASLDLSFSVADSVTDGTTTDFSIVGGGAVFQLGPYVVSNQQARLGIQSVNTTQLGGVSGNLYELRSGNDKSLANDVIGAAAIVQETITDIVNLRGRLGAFQRTTLGTNIASLSDSLEALTEAESDIRDTDFATESASLTRAQILSQSGISVLAIANSNPEAVLSLLR